MEKSEWLDFLCVKLRSQISFESSQKTQNWLLALLGFAALGFALNAVQLLEDRAHLFATKILFLILFHALMTLGFYLPQLSAKGEKPAARLFRIHDFIVLRSISIAASAYAVMVAMLSFQISKMAGESNMSPFFGFTVWVNVMASIFYVALSLFQLLGIAWFPGAVVKWSEKSAKTAPIFLGVHAVLFFLLGFGYSEVSVIGSVSFFAHFRIVGLFWIFIVSSLLLTGRVFQSSSLASLSALEMEVVSGKLTKHEDILVRFKEAFVSRRLSAWVSRLSHRVATDSHQIAQHSHEAVTLVAHNKPSELDLRQVEDRYRRAEQLYKKLEKENQKFILTLSFLDLSEVGRERAEGLRDLFSRELRNAKLELAGVRKRIDDKLTSLKETRSIIPEEIPLEKVPVTY